MALPVREAASAGTGGKAGKRLQLGYGIFRLPQPSGRVPAGRDHFLFMQFVLRRLLSAARLCRDLPPDAAAVGEPAFDVAVNRGHCDTAAVAVFVRLKFTGSQQFIQPRQTDREEPAGFLRRYRKRWCGYAW